GAGTCECAAAVLGWLVGCSGVVVARWCGRAQLYCCSGRLVRVVGAHYWGSGRTGDCCSGCAVPLVWWGCLWFEDCIVDASIFACMPRVALFWGCVGCVRDFCGQVF